MAVLSRTSGGPLREVLERICSEGRICSPADPIATISKAGRKGAGAQKASVDEWRRTLAKQSTVLDLHLRSVKRFIDLVAGKGHLFVGAIKRQISKRIYEECSKVDVAWM